MPIVWKNIFNTSHFLYGHITKGQEAAVSAGYPYFIWNGYVYDTVNVKRVCLETEIQ